MTLELRRPSTIDPLIDEIKDTVDNIFSNLDTVIPGNHNEKVYPYDSIGIVSSSIANQWNGVKVLIPIDGVFADYGWESSGTPVDYSLVGAYIISKVNPDRTINLQLLRVVKATGVSLDATSGAGEANPDRIQIPDTSPFLVDDWVWIKDDLTPDGEMGKVEAIVTNDYLDLVGNLTNTYTVAQNAKVYLVRRATPAYRTFWGKWSMSNVKEMGRHIFFAPRCFDTGDGIIARIYDLEGVTGTEVYISAIYVDC